MIINHILHFLNFQDCKLICSLHLLTLITNWHYFIANFSWRWTYINHSLCSIILHLFLLFNWIPHNFKDVQRSFVIIFLLYIVLLNLLPFAIIIY